MDVALKPEVQQFIVDQVQAGRYRSVSDLIESAVARLMLDPAPDEPMAEDLAAVREGLDQLNRGEGKPWEQVRARLAAKYGLDR